MTCSIHLDPSCYLSESDNDEEPPNAVTVPATTSTRDLYTRLALLTTDHQEIQRENAQEQNVIEHLLASRIWELKVKKEVIILHEEISSLKQKLAEQMKDSQQLRIELRKAIDIISPLATHTTVTTTSQRNSVLGEDDVKANNTTTNNTHDLIDLSDHSGEPAHAEWASAGTTSSNDDDDDDYVSSFSDDVQQCQATKWFNEENGFEGLPYIHHFVDKDDKTDGRGSAKVVRTNKKHPRGLEQLEPQWVSSTFFEIKGELSNAFIVYQRTARFDDLLHPDYFKYGLRWTPDHEQHNVFRTVTISGLPTSITTSMLLDNVRGGAIIESKLLDTLKILGSNTALVTFSYEHSALAYEEYVRKHPVIFDGLAARVAVLPTPTWPMKPKLCRDVYDNKYSRCLEIYNFPRAISEFRLRWDLGRFEGLKLDQLIHIEVRKDGTMVLQCSSIDGASRAYGMLSSHRAYRGCEPFFTPDPCSQPLETLHALTDVDSNVAKVVTTDKEQKSRTLAYERPISTTESTISGSSDEDDFNEMISFSKKMASKET